MPPKGGQGVPAHLRLGKRDAGPEASACNPLRIGLELGAPFELCGCLRPLVQRRQDLRSSTGSQWGGDAEGVSVGLLLCVGYGFPPGPSPQNPAEADRPSMKGLHSCSGPDGYRACWRVPAMGFWGERQQVTGHPQN